MNRVILYLVALPDRKFFSSVRDFYSETFRSPICRTQVSAIRLGREWAEQTFGPHQLVRIERVSLEQFNRTARKEATC